MSRMVLVVAPSMVATLLISISTSIDRTQRLSEKFPASKTGNGGRLVWKHPETGVMHQLWLEFREMKKRDVCQSLYQGDTKTTLTKATASLIPDVADEI